MNTKRVCQACQAELPVDSPLRLCPQCNGSGVTMPVAAGAPFHFSPPAPEDIAALFPQLEILQLIGRGGMGAVYKARQNGLERVVALKILPPQMSADASFAERFAREARALARLNHSNIVSVFDLGRSGPLYYFLMEFVDGVNLRQMLKRGALAPREALALMHQVCEAIEYAHGEGVIHRDIKPENILVDPRGRVKIADFGLAKLLGPAQTAQLTQAGQVMGSFHYMAPEQFEKPLEVDHRADIYALGVVLYEMLTGELPLGRFELPSKRAAVDSQHDELILRALERNPERRFAQASDLRTQLEAIAGISSRLTPEASRKLSYEFRSKASLFGWPLVHVATGVDPRTGRKRTARGIIAVGTAPRGLIAFGDVTVGFVACGIFGYGVISLSVVAIGIFACGSIAAGLAGAMGGLVVAPLAMGGAAVGWYANGAIAWGKHAVSPYFQDPVGQKFFSPYSVKIMYWAFRCMLVAVPIFLTMGFVPAIMSRLSERRARRRLSG